MLRFNGLITLIIDKYIEFQYILCYGSTNPLQKQFFALYHISIHPMLRFNVLRI